MAPQLIVLRAVNVGGNTVKPKALADTLGLINFGAAGTFVAPDEDPGHARRLREALPFETELISIPGPVIEALLRDTEAAPPGAKAFVTFLAGEPASAPALPLCFPDEADWQLRVVSIAPPIVVSHRRAKKPGTFYPNELVEKALGVPATSRTWATLEKVARRL